LSDAGQDICHEQIEQRESTKYIVFFELDEDDEVDINKDRYMVPISEVRYFSTTLLKAFECLKRILDIDTLSSAEDRIKRELDHIKRIQKSLDKQEIEISFLKYQKPLILDRINKILKNLENEIVEEEFEDGES
jgi:hypothetical protein